MRFSCFEREGNEYEPGRGDSESELSPEADTAALMIRMSQDHVDQDHTIAEFRLNLERQRQLPDQPQLRGGTSMDSFHSIPAPEARSWDSREELFNYLSEFSMQHGFTLVKSTGGSKGRNRNGIEFKMWLSCSKGLSDSFMSKRRQILDQQGIEKTRNKESAKSGCRFTCICIAVDKEAPEGPWRLTLGKTPFHNHPGVDSIGLAGHRRALLTDQIKKFVIEGHKAGVPAKQLRFDTAIDFYKK